MYSSPLPTHNSPLTHSSSAAPYDIPTPHFLIQVQQPILPPYSLISHTSTAALSTTILPTFSFKDSSPLPPALLPNFSFKDSSPLPPPYSLISYSSTAAPCHHPTFHFLIQEEQPLTTAPPPLSHLRTASPYHRPIPTFSFKHSIRQSPYPRPPFFHSCTEAPYHRTTPHLLIQVQQPLTTSLHPTFSFKYNSPFYSLTP